MSTIQLVLMTGTFQSVPKSHQNTADLMISPAGNR